MVTKCLTCRTIWLHWHWKDGTGRAMIIHSPLFTSASCPFYFFFHLTPTVSSSLFVVKSVISRVKLFPTVWCNCYPVFSYNKILWVRFHEIDWFSLQSILNASGKFGPSLSLAESSLIIVTGTNTDLVRAADLCPILGTYLNKFLHAFMFVWLFLVGNICYGNITWLSRYYMSVG